MAYCTRDDMINRFGEDEIMQLTDRDNLGIIDDTVLTQAIDDASAEIDTYLSKYSLPLAVVPQNMRRINCDIARFNLYDDSDNEPVDKLYKIAVKFLDRVEKGLTSLGVDNLGKSPETNNGAVMESGGRVFSRNDNGFI